MLGCKVEIYPSSDSISIVLPRRGFFTPRRVGGSDEGSERVARDGSVSELEHPFLPRYWGGYLSVPGTKLECRGSRVSRRGKI
eukprot:639211-Rhodomonas_salina.2